MKLSINFNETMDIVDGLFLLFLAISGNFVAETLGCQTQELLTTNTYAKQLITFFIIFFTIDFSDKKNENPRDKLIKASALYLFFLVFTKMDLKATGLVFILLFTLYLTNSYRKFNNNAYTSLKNPTKEEDKIYKETEEKYMDFQEKLVYTIIACVAIGFITYYNEKKLEYKENFTLLKFICGVSKCKGMA